MPKILGIEEGSFDGSLSLKKISDITVIREEWSQTYLILADNINQTKDDIYLTPGLPVMYQIIGGGSVKGKTATETGTIIKHPVTGVQASLWEVEIQVDTDVDRSQQPQNPLAKPPVVKWTGETEDEVLERDPITGDPVQTDAEEPIIITTPIVLPVLSITRLEPYPFNPDIMLDYAHHTNSHVFWGAPPGSALMLPMEVDEQTIENVKYVSVTYKIKFKIKKQGGLMLQDTWKARVLHHGFKYRKVANGVPEIYTDANGNPATVNLVNGTGLKKDNNASPDYKEFNRFTKVNLNNLSLGPF